MNSHEDTKPRRDKEELARIVVDCGFRLHKELGPGLLENALLIELKSVSKLMPVHSKQVLTYLRLLNLPLGLLINYGSATFKEGIKRIVNGPQDFTNSSLLINRSPS
ncbi:MAG: GxxExxY protein [Akkermansiaceae bacterium]|nr:GxxExxY protein [Akkermansiaceae bacterium]